MKTLYLVMDLINDLVHPDGANGSGLAAEVTRLDVLKNSATAIAKGRNEGVPIGYVIVGWSQDYREWPDNSPMFSPAREHQLLKLGTWSTEIHDAVKPLQEDYIIIKHRVSPFYGTNLEPILRAQNISRLVMSGVSTNYVLQSGVREAHDRGYEVVILEDACAALSEEEHQWAINGLSRMATITTSQNFTFAES